MNRSRLFIILAAVATVLLSATKIYAVPAVDAPLTVPRSDGTALTVLLKGDEFVHYATTTDGYCVVQDAGGVYRYALLEAGVLVASDVEASNPSQRSAEELAALSRFFRGVPPAFDSQTSSRRRSEAGMDVESLKSVREQNAQTRVEGSKRYPVILVNFSNKAFSTASPRQAFDDLLNQQGYSLANATGSVRDYFFDNSGGEFAPQFDVYGPYTLPEKMAYYGARTPNMDDAHVDSMIVQACRLADADVNFAEYAVNGYTPVYIYFAGYNEAEGGGNDAIWPHSGRINASFDGVNIQRYACISELKGRSGGVMSAIGTFCHEFGHTLGLPDFYDVFSSEVNKPIALKKLSLMSSGNYNNSGRTPPALSSLERMLLGWIEPMRITSAGAYTLQPLYDGKAYRINTAVEDEFFIFESRNRSNKWDAAIENGGEGLMVYHVDMSNNAVKDANIPAVNLWLNNSVNGYSSHECMKSVRASHTDAIADWFFPGTSNAVTLDSRSNSEYLCWSGMPNGYNLSDITFNGSAVTFNVTSLPEGYVSGTVADIEGVRLSGAKAFLCKVTATKVETGDMTLFAPESLTRAEVMYESACDAEGRYSFADVPFGQYMLSVSCEGYDDYSKLVDVSLGGIVDDVVMNTPVQTGGRYVSWAADGYFAVSIGNSITKIASRYSYRDAGMTATSGMLKGVKIFFDDTSTVTLDIYKNVAANMTDGVEPYATVAVAADRVGWNYADLSQCGITLTKDDYVTLVFDLSDYTGDFLRSDKGVETNTFGGMFCQNGKWYYFSDGLTFYNWYIGAYFFDGTQISGIVLDEQPVVNLYAGDVYRIDYTLTPSNAGAGLEWHSLNPQVATVETGGIVRALTPGTTAVYAVSGTLKSNSVEFSVAGDPDQLVCNVYQNDALVSWMPIGYDGDWTVGFGLSGSQQTEILNVSDTVIYLGGLVPGQKYSISVTPAVATESVGQRDAEFTTATVQGRFASMYRLAGVYAVGQQIPLVVIDVQGTLSSVSWTLDGRSVTPPVITPAAGRHRIEVVVTTIDGQQEKLMKTIRVE